MRSVGRSTVRGQFPGLEERDVTENIRQREERASSCSSIKVKRAIGRFPSLSSSSDFGARAVGRLFDRYVWLRLPAFKLKENDDEWSNIHAAH